MICRRDFLRSMSASGFLAGYPVAGFTQDLPPGRIGLIILEGGLDGLAAVPPVGDPALVRQRAKLVANAPLELNPFFALHPRLRNFAEMLYLNEAAIIHATAFPYTRRSHFEGQNLVETGVTEPFSSPTGWLGRAMDLAGIAGRALSLDTPLVIRGAVTLDNFYPANIGGSFGPDRRLLSLLVDAHQSEDTRTAFSRLEETLDSTSALPRVRDPEGLALAAGQAMRTDDGPRVSVIRIPEFDTHANQGANIGQHPELLALLDRIFVAYKAGLKEQWANTVILTATEFGRTVSINGSDGTDHGYGSAALLAGGLLKRSSVIANWPGLGARDLFEGQDLYATMDYRSVCAACIEAALGLDHDTIAERVFGAPDLPRVYDLVFA
jgi:uncharacterized protein (DUF1501 family)